MPSAIRRAEILGRFGVDRGRVGIGVRRQINLGLGNVQEVAGLAGGTRARFVAGQHVVGWGGDIGGAPGGRPQAAEWLDEGHDRRFLIQVVRASVR